VGNFNYACKFLLEANAVGIIVWVRLTNKFVSISFLSAQINN
jgi:hypothetical protein